MSVKDAVRIRGLEAKLEELELRVRMLERKEELLATPADVRAELAQQRPVLGLKSKGEGSGNA